MYRIRYLRSLLRTLLKYIENPRYSTTVIPNQGAGVSCSIKFGTTAFLLMFHYIWYRQIVIFTD